MQGVKKLGGLKAPELGESSSAVLGTGAERCWHKWVLIPVTPARLGISLHARGSGKHGGTAGSEPAVEPVTLPNVPSRPGYPRPGWVVARSRLSLLSQGVKALLFLASWTLVCGHGCCQACGYQGGLQPAQPAQPARPAEPLPLVGQDPFPAPWGHQLDPSETHPSPWDPASPQPSEGTASCLLSPAVSPVPLHPCSDPPPHPCLPSLHPFLCPLGSGTTPTQTPNESPAPLDLSAALAVYSAAFGAVGHRQPWALVPAAWLTSAQLYSVWEESALSLVPQHSLSSTSLSLWGMSPAL